MGQSQSNQAGAANDEKIAKFKALMGSTDPKDRAQLEVYQASVDQIIQGIEKEKANMKTNYLKTKYMSNKNYQNKMAMMEEREKKLQNALKEKANRNKNIQASITRSQLE